MNHQAFQFQYEEYLNPEELSEAQMELVSLAVETARKAYAPYSSFLVGAALRLEDGTVITGNNQENAAYPSGICAERVALFYAGAQHPGVAVTSIAIAALREDTILEEPVSPCGGCRQVMLEKELQGRKPMEVILCGSGKIRVIRSASDLLPLPFTLK